MLILVEWVRSLGAVLFTTKPDETVINQRHPTCLSLLHKTFTTFVSLCLPYDIICSHDA